MHEFPANSAKVRSRSDGPPSDERPRVEQVTSATADRRKRGLGRKFKETFIGGSARMAFEYMVVDVVIPAIQDTMIDAFQGGIERLIKGEGRSRRGVPSAFSNAGHVDYRGMGMNRATTQSRPSSSRMLSRQSRTRHDFDELVIPTRAEAEEVVDQLFDMLSRFEVVTVADLYEMTGIQSSHTDVKWGWTSLRGAKVQRLRNGGYLLNLPEPEPLP
jgi:hypothetical protein